MLSFKDDVLKVNKKHMIKLNSILDYLINHPYSPTLIGFIVNFSKSKRYVKNDKLKKFRSDFESNIPKRPY